MDVNLPIERQPSSLDSKLGIIVPRVAEFYILNRLVVGEDLLHPFVELLDKCSQIIRGVEFGVAQHLWLQAERSVCEEDQSAPWIAALALAVTNSPPWSKPKIVVIQPKI